jgi:anaerobic nitric oxide reductase flavorubredoxin
MPAVEVRPGIHWAGVNDRTSDLFEGFWPVAREGVSHNSYLVNDEKKALIDITSESLLESLLSQIATVTDPAGLDYIVINHMEPDHTGALRALRRLAPHATLLGSKKAVEMMESYYGVTEGVRAVEDGETLSLGRNTLQFFSTPFVHWPETIMTYAQEQKVLFSCDGFGGYGALQGSIFADECADLRFYEEEALRYYTNIVALFGKQVLKAIDRLKELLVEVVAPSHGLVWRRDPGRIVELYRTWAGYATGPVEPGVTVIFGTMYGNTRAMAEAVAAGVAGAGLPVTLFDAARVHPSYILPAIYSRQGVLVGSATYEGGLFPPVRNLLSLVESKRIVGRTAAFFGSRGWGGGARREFARQAETLQWKVVDAWEVQGGPTAGVLQEGEELGRRFAASLRG